MYWKPILDEDGLETEFEYVYDTFPYGFVRICYTDEVVRFRYWNNHVVPYENLETGTLYDDLENLCYQMFYVLN